MRPGPNNTFFDGFDALGEVCNWPGSPTDAYAYVKQTAYNNMPRMGLYERLNACKPRARSNNRDHDFAVGLNQLQVVQLPQPRYFRMMVWNLENFTQNSRPRGTSRLDSQHNQARIALVAECAFRLGIDALMIMETGDDVGQLTTQLAQAWQTKEDELAQRIARKFSPHHPQARVRKVEPLVSANTHAMPTLPVDFKVGYRPPNSKLKTTNSIHRIGTEMVGALALAGTGYRISMDNKALLPDQDQFEQAFLLLDWHCSSMAYLDEMPTLAKTPAVNMHAWYDWCIAMSTKLIIGGPFGCPCQWDTVNNPHIQLAVQAIADLRYALQHSMDQIRRDSVDKNSRHTSTRRVMREKKYSYSPYDWQGDGERTITRTPKIDLKTVRNAKQAIVDTAGVHGARSISDAILAARAIVSDFGGRHCVHTGVAQAMEATLLLWQYMALAVEDDKAFPDQNSMDQDDIKLRSCWFNAPGQIGHLVPLSLLLALGRTLQMEAHDGINPLNSTDDGELLTNALVRMKIVERARFETYAMLYRPYDQRYLEAFFEADFRDLGYSTEGLYGILHGDKSRTLKAQTPGHILGGRGGLWVQFPLINQTVGVVMHHNRFTGTAAIGSMTNYTKSNNTLLARLDTIDDEAELLAGMAGPPLLVGDFNLPASLLEPEQGNNVKGLRERREMRQKYLHSMEGYGYLRHRRPDGTHPLTSLRRGLTIAKTGEIGSQPYDAVYQPFDFMQGQTDVRSCVLTQPHAFFKWPDLLDQTITGVPWAPPPPQGTQPQPRQPERITLNNMLLGQVMRSYAGVLKTITNTLTDAVSWMEDVGTNHMDEDTRNAAWNLYGLVELTCNELTQRRTFFRTMLQEGLDKTIDQGHQDMVKAFDRQSFEDVSGMIDLLRDAIDESRQHDKAEQQERDDALQDEEVDLAFAQDDDDDEGEGEAPVVKARRKPRPAYHRLLDIPDLFRAIARMEDEPDVRLWIAYTHVISDHLPLLIEIDLNP